MTNPRLNSILDGRKMLWRTLVGHWQNWNMNGQSHNYSNTITEVDDYGYPWDYPYSWEKCIDRFKGKGHDKCHFFSISSVEKIV